MSRIEAPQEAFCMMHFEQLWQAVRDHVVLLLILLPAFGAFAVRMIGPSNLAGARAIARSNAWASLVLLAILVSQFQSTTDGSTSNWQQRSAITWVRIAPSLEYEEASAPSEKSTPAVAPIEIRMAVAIDGFGLPFVALVVAVAFAVIRDWSERSDDSYNASHQQLADALLVQSTLLAVLTATDAVWLSVCVLMATGAMFSLLSRSGQSERRIAAAKFLRSQLISAMMLVLGVLGLAVSCWWMSIRRETTAAFTFDLPTIVDRLPRLGMATQAVHDHWELVGPWLFLLIAGGCVLRVPLPPFHPWFPAVAQQTERGTLALLLVGWMPTGMVLGLRLLATAFAPESLQLGDRVIVWCALSACGMSCSSIAIKDPQRRFGVLLSAVGAMAFGGIWVGSTSAVHGSLLLLAGASGVGALTLLTKPDWWTRSMASDRDGWETHLLSDDGDHEAQRLGLKLLGLLATTVGSWCLLRNYFSIGGMRLAFVMTVGFVMWSISTWPHSNGRSNHSQSANLVSRRLIPLVVVLGVLGLWPQSVVNAVHSEPSDAAMAEPEAE